MTYTYGYKGHIGLLPRFKKMSYSSLVQFPSVVKQYLCKDPSIHTANKKATQSLDLKYFFFQAPKTSSASSPFYVSFPANLIGSCGPGVFFCGMGREIAYVFSLPLLQENMSGPPRLQNSTAILCSGPTAAHYLYILTNNRFLVSYKCTDARCLAGKAELCDAPLWLHVRSHPYPQHPNLSQTENNSNSQLHINWNPNDEKYR